MGESAKFEAVFFFDKNGLAKEMLYQEFESFLDGMIGMPDMAGRKAQAVYVKINASLKITAMVFFTIGFDKQGIADSRWNLPLKLLPNKGVDGPDMGAGAVKIYMQGTNANAEYNAYLWDPSERGGKNDLIHVRDAVKKNRLCLTTDEDTSEWMGNAEMVMRDVAPEPTPIPDIKKSMAVDDSSIPLATSTLASTDNDEFSQAIKIIESQRIKITALENALLTKNKGNPESDEEIKKLKDALLKSQNNLIEAQKNEDKLTLQKQAIEDKLNDIKKELIKSEKEIEKTKQSVEKLNEQAKEKLNKFKEQHQASLILEKEKIEKQFLQKIQRLEKEIETAQEDVAKEKDTELRAERQKIENLNKELTTLRGDKFRLVKDGAEAFFKKIDQADISFMAFKPGAGHLTIDADDMASFLENPNIIVAGKCGLSVDAYENWLEHYKNPLCNAPMPEGKLCGNKVSRTDIPSKYKKGVSDRCVSHNGR